MNTPSTERPSPGPALPRASPRRIVAIAPATPPVSSTGRLAALLADTAAAHLRRGGVDAQTDHVQLRDTAADAVASLIDGVVRPPGRSSDRLRSAC